MEIFYYLCFALWGVVCASRKLSMSKVFAGVVLLWIIRFVVLKV